MFAFKRSRGGSAAFAMDVSVNTVRLFPAKITISELTGPEIRQ